MTDRLDSLLDRLEAPPLPPGLRTRVLAHAPRPSRGFLAELWATLGGTKVAAPAFGCAMALGFGLGAIGAPEETEPDLDAMEWVVIADDYSDFGT